MGAADGDAGDEDQIDWKAEAELARAELDEFLESSKALEEELEAELDASEDKRKKLETALLSAREDIASLKASGGGSSSALHGIDEVQMELAAVKEDLRAVRAANRELEQANDGLEAAKRIRETSAEDMREKLDKALEQIAFLQGDLEEQSEKSAVTIQRLRGEVTDLKSDAEVKEKQAALRDPEEIGVLKAKLEELEEELQEELNRNDDLSEEIENLTDELMSSKSAAGNASELEDARKALEDANARIEALEVDLSDASVAKDANAHQVGELEDARRALNDANARIGALEGELSDAAGARDAIARQAQELRTEIETLNGQVSALKDAKSLGVDALQAETDTLKNQLEQSRRDCDIANGANAQSQEEVRLLKERLEKASDANAKLELARAELQGRLEDASDANAKLDLARAGLQEQLEDASDANAQLTLVRAELQKSRAKHEKDQGLLEEMQKRNAELQDQITSLKKQNASLSHDVAEETGKAIDTSEEMERLRSKLAQVEEHNSDILNENTSLKDQIASLETVKVTLTEKGKAKNNLVVNLQKELEGVETKLKELQLRKTKNNVDDFDDRLRTISASIKAGGSDASEALEDLQLQLSSALNAKAGLEMELHSSKLKLERTLSSNEETPRKGSESSEGGGGLFGWLGSGKKRRPSASASTHRQLQADLEAAKGALRDMQVQYSELELKYKKERGAARKLSENNLKLAEEKDCLESKSSTSAGEVKALEEKLKFALDTRHKLARDLKMERVKRKEIEANLSDNEKELRALRETSTSKTERGMLSDLELALNETRKELFDLRARSSSETPSISVSLSPTPDQQTASEDLQDAYRKLADAKTQLRVAENRAISAEKKLREYEQKVSDLEARRSADKAELMKNSAAKVEQLLQQETALEKKLGEARAEAVKARNHARDLETSLRSEVKALRKEISEERAKRQDAEQQLQLHGKEVQRLRTRARELGASSPLASSKSPPSTRNRARSSSNTTPKVVKVDLDAPASKRSAGKSLSPSRLRQPSPSRLRQPARKVSRLRAPVAQAAAKSLSSKIVGGKKKETSLPASTPVSKRTRSSGRRYNTRASSRLKPPGFASKK